MADRAMIRGLYAPSIRQAYAEQILRGTKTIEYRSRRIDFRRNTGTPVFVFDFYQGADQS